MKIPEWLPDTQRPLGPERQRRETAIEPLLRPVVEFLQVEAAGGVVLLLSAVVAIILANSPWSQQVTEFWEIPVGFALGRFQLQQTLLHCINDGLMTVFFFVVGLEIKREIAFGELREIRKEALPAVAALGGMVVPATLYLLFQGSGEGSRGWGIPMATDIAFVVGSLTLLGSRVSLELKMFLLTLAIADDIGAILVVAIAYSDGVSPVFLGFGIAGFGMTWLLRRIGVRATAVYAILGIGIWLAFVNSGVHPTVAGVVLGLLTPAAPWFGEESLANVAEGVAHRLREDSVDDDLDHHEEAARVVARTARESVSPLDRLETALHPWVAFVIMPLFALANAGVRVEMSSAADPIALAVSAALVIGKPLGIVGFSWAAVTAGIAQMPTGVNWRVLLGASCLAGIGFTMSLFIAGLAFEGAPLAAGKTGALAGSALSALLGMVLLLYSLPPASTSAEADPS